MSTETNTVPVGRIVPLYNDLKKDIRGDRKKRESRKGRTGSGGTTQNKQNKKRKTHYTDEDLALLNRPKLLMDLWIALMSALDTEFKPSKKPLSRLQALGSL